MRAFEFEALLNAEHAITIPPEIFVQLGLPAGSVRVMILVSDDEEDERDWVRMGTQQLFKNEDEEYP